MKVELSLAALDTLWEDLRLGRVPFPLEVRSHGDTVEIRERIKTAVYADLARRGLAAGTRPDDGLVEKLRLLAEPAVSVDLVALLDMEDTVPLRAVAALRGRHGLLAVQRRLTVSMRGTRAAMVVAALVGLLPNTPAGTEKSITKPAAALRAGRGLVHAGGVVRTATARVATIMERPVLRAGQLGVTRVDESGRRQREPGIGWFDTDEGRYATTMTAGPDGEDWVTVWPADNARLTHRLGETITAACPK
jgi:EspG family